jgi:hypothetical protein
VGTGFTLVSLLGGEGGFVGVALTPQGQKGQALGSLTTEQHCLPT